MEYIPKASVREIILETWTLVLKSRGLGRHGHSFLQASVWSMMVRTLKVMDELETYEVGAGMFWPTNCSFTNCHLDPLSLSGLCVKALSRVSINGVLPSANGGVS